ncbi:uncharacterized protein LOC121371384 isoform X2 [Gigantopelta aegis]|nr:uncharacterized protein LOC121371384 isoform X2 [Gigantopelta aegis]XP_041353166.1 uncharacterized protein LOC121371384 isoform X2 [Gigantopelta aegis]XP_041353168.1 uncharacterized protein LOC121371384 isoform X2 [Gigantopelta aegis]
MTSFFRNILGMNDKEGSAENATNYNGYEVDYQTGANFSSNRNKSIDDLLKQYQGQRASYPNLQFHVQQLTENNEFQMELINRLVQERRQLVIENKRLSEEKIRFTRKIETQSKEIGDLKNEVMDLKRSLTTQQSNVPPPHSEWKLAESIFSYRTSPRKQKYVEVPKKRPQVHVYFFSPQRDQIPPISDITNRLAESLSQQDIELVTDIISETPVSDDARPAILLCINVSRVGTDVANALKDMKADYNVAVVVLHHKDIHVLPKLSSVKSLTGREFQNLGTIVDMAFWKEKGLHQCDMNQLAIQKLSDFLKMFILPGN